jgi:archaeal flagellar protein FlaI
MPFPGFNRKKKKNSPGKRGSGDPDPNDILKLSNGGDDDGHDHEKESGYEQVTGVATPSGEETPEVPLPVDEEPEESGTEDATAEPEEKAITIEYLNKSDWSSEEPAKGEIVREPVTLPVVEPESGDEDTEMQDEEAIEGEEAPDEFVRQPVEEAGETGKPEEPAEEETEKPEEPGSEESAGEPGTPVEEDHKTGEETGTTRDISEDEGEEGLSNVIRRKKPRKAIIKDEKKGFLFLKKKVETIRLYDFEIDGPLVDPVLPEGYVLSDEYWIHEGRSKILIAKNPDTHLNEYLLYEPKLSGFERELAERLYEDMRDVLILTDEEIVEGREGVLMEKMNRLLHEYKVNIEDEALFKLQYYLLRNFLGWSRLDPLMFDPNIEDISCDGSDIPLFLYHRKFRNIKTNISFDEDTLYSLAILLAQRSGKHISVSQPMLDATLPDGSRLQLTLGKVVTSRGTSFTIRKFREEPFTPIELIEYGTFNVDQLVYFWLAIENNKSLLFVGGTASGKTTSLNAVSLFIPPLSKVVSIEDTREITLYHDNWLATVTRESVVETSGSKVDMFDLLKAAMRQRPEYILVGEVRGVEAQTLFQAMNTGHTTFSTLHANSVDAAIHRLESPPLNVPRNMVQALDIVSIQALVYRGQDRVRRAMEIVEIVGIDPGTGNLRVNAVFEYDPVKDAHSYSGRSQVYSKIMEIRGWSREVMNEEIERRRIVMQAMHDQGIIDYISVTKIFQAYFINSANVLENIGDLKKAFI